MIEVEFKNKTAKHGLRVKGKRIQFIDGKAFVSEDEAKAIMDVGDKDYRIIKPVEPVKEDVKPKKAKKGKGKK